MEAALSITRLFDAPRELVFEAWTNPDHLAKWWGPAGFTTASCTVNLTEGGGWRTCMRDNVDGVEIWARGTYREIVAPERLVFSFAWEEPPGVPGLDTLVSVTFADRDGKTEMTFQQAVFESAEDRDSHRSGWQGCFDDLAGYLAGGVRERTH
jgi:uncharacterized protein YndB with AHSA1/START domain